MSEHSSKPRILWLNALVFLSTFLVAIIATPWYAVTIGFTWQEIVAAVLCLGYCGISITAGYHRLWAHKAYQAHPALEVLFALGGAFALQNSALHWSSDHRVHHGQVDHPEHDPYAATKGFWYSHIGWMLRDYQGERYGNYQNVRDLQKNPIVMWQHRHYLTLTLLTNFGIPALLGLMIGSFWGMMLLAGVVRLVLNHHFTFFINSLAHIWGKRPYSVQNTARDNGWLALLTYGEGYHNFHHHFAADYRNGIKWWHFDPTKWLIKCCSWLGLAHALKVTPEEMIEKAKATALLQQTKSRLSGFPKCESQLKLLQSEYDLLIHRLSAYYAHKKQVLDLKKQNLLQQYESSEFLKQYTILKQQWQAQKKHWLALNQALA